MQVSVEETSELMRKMTVQVPEEKIQSEVAKRLQSLAQKARLDGFRPGKVPGKVIKKRFGEPVRQEVVAELIQSSLYDALMDKKLQPAGAPHIEKKDLDEGLEFEAMFEVYPEFDLCPYSELKITRPQCEIVDADLDDMVEKLRDQRKNWESVDRAAQEGDQLTILFSGTVDGEDFTNGTVEDFKVELGSEQMIPGFEDELLNLEVGSKKTFSLDFPEDYNNEKLAGKNAEFEVEVRQIEVSSPAEINEEFVKSLGIDSGAVSDLRDSLKGNMEQEVENIIRGQVKQSVMDELLKNNQLTLPKVMVDQEIERLQQSKENRAGAPDDGEVNEPGGYEEEARRRVTLGLVLAEIIKKHKLTADPERVRATINGLAQSYQSPEDVVNWYYSNEDQLKSIEHMVLEDQVVDTVLADATITEEVTDFQSITNPS